MSSYQVDDVCRGGIVIRTTATVVVLQLLITLLIKFLQPLTNCTNTLKHLGPPHLSSFHGFFFFFAPFSMYTVSVLHQSGFNTQPSSSKIPGNMVKVQGTFIGKISVPG